MDPLQVSERIARKLLEPLKTPTDSPDADERFREITRRLAAVVDAHLKPFRGLERPAQLHHYATAPGLRGFLSSDHGKSWGESETKTRTFWGSLATHLNDQRELVTGQALWVKEVEALQDDPHLVALLDGLDLDWRTKLDPLSPWSNVYVACFTENKDSMPLWQRYTDGEATH
jgi:hypothetical protein